MTDGPRVVPEQIKNIVDGLKKGQAIEHVQVREFLTWFGIERRGYQNTRNVRAVLEEAKLQTQPDFDAISYYSYVDFSLAAADDTNCIDPTIRLRRIEQINKSVHSCKPDDILAKVVQTMIMEDYSQIPVMPNQRDVKGVVTWDAIARAAVLGKAYHTAADVMEDALEAPITAALSDVIPLVAAAGYVLVRDVNRSIYGIMTTFDLNGIFLSLSGAFLSLGEIEGYLRRLIRHKFTKEQLTAATFGEDRGVTGPHDLTLGELIRLIEAEQNWVKLGLRLERAQFIESLNRVRDIRNDVMHFDPEGVPAEDQKLLVKFVALLRQIEN